MLTLNPQCKYATLKQMSLRETVNLGSVEQYLRNSVLHIISCKSKTTEKPKSVNLYKQSGR